MTTDSRCSYCLAYHAACAGLRLFSGRSCCCECDHGSTLPPTPHPSSDR